MPTIQQVGKPRVRLRALPAVLPLNIELQATDEAIQWRYVGAADDTWLDLVLIDDIDVEVTVGAVTTLAAGEPASVFNSGTSRDIVLDFGIPAGSDGTMSSVVAGSGIDVDATDPGNPVVSVEAPLADLASRFTPASSSGPSSLDLLEDADNGTSRVRLTAAASLTADRTVTFPDADGTAMLTSAIGTHVQAWDADLDAIADTGIVALAGTLWGLTLANNGSDATNDIDVAAGVAIDITNAVLMRLASGLTKRLDASWAVGSGNGGRDTGSIADGTWHVHLIKRPDTGVVDVLFSLSATAPTLPTNYTVFRRIGSIIRESAAIVGFIQKGDRFDRLVAAGDVNAVNPGSSAVTASLSVPGGISVEAVLSFMIKDDTPASATALLLTALDVTNSTASVSSRFHTAITNAGATTPQYGVGQCTMRTNTSGQVRYRLSASDADITVRIVTHGWVDDRGRTE